MDGRRHMRKEDVCYRHRQDKLEHCQTDGRSIDESASSQDKVCKSPLARVSRGKPLMGVFIVTAQVTAVLNRCLEQQVVAQM